MAFEGLSEKLSAAFKKLRGKGRLSEADVKEAMREIRLALLEADVSFKVVKQFVAQVTEKAVGAVDRADICTMENEDEFYSHRRDGAERGVMAAAIML